MKQYVIVFLSGALIAGGIVKIYFPTIETKTVEKLIVKTEIQTKTRTVTKEVTLPNGTIEKSTTVDLNIVELSKTDSLSAMPPNWFVTLSKQDDLFILQANRRLLGDFFISGSIDSKLHYSVGAGISF
jgi:hypothetical protein